MPDDILIKASLCMLTFFVHSPHVHDTVYGEDDEQSHGFVENAKAVHHSTRRDVLHDLYPLLDEPIPLTVPPVADDRSDRDERAAAVYVHSSSGFRLE
jgi:hypothetical protein